MQEGLGAGMGFEVIEVRRRGAGFRGHYCSFFRQRDHFPFPPDGCWCRELLWCDGIDLDTTPTATATKPNWPLGSHTVQTSSAATMVAAGPQWHRLTAPRPPSICLTPLHAWPFYSWCPNRGGRWHPLMVPADPSWCAFLVQWQWKGCFTLIQWSATGSFWQWQTDK